jgi:hypothetical protein
MTMNPAPFSLSVIYMETSSESRLSRGGDGTAPSAGPGRGFAVPPGGGGGNTPTPSGSGKLLGGRGLPECDSSSALRELASAAYAASATSNTSAAPDAKNASNGRRLVLPDGSVVNIPSGFVAKVAKRGGVVYRVGSKDAILRLTAKLLFRVSRGKGSTVYLNGRKIATLLGLRNGHLDAYSSSWVRGILALLGFEVMRTTKGVVVIISMRHPLIEKIKAVKSIDEAIQVIRKHLGE